MFNNITVHIFFFCFFTLSLFGADVPLIHLSALPSAFPSENDSIHLLNGQKIRVRGFLYSISENEMVLATQPKLKSCCVGKSAQHIRIQDSVSMPMTHNSAVLVEGIFRIQQNEKNNSEQFLNRSFYFLEKAQIVSESMNVSFSLFLILLMGFVFILIIKYRLNYNSFLSYNPPT